MYLLDTHTLLWYLEENDNKLSENALRIINNQSHIKHISISSLWEITIKYSLQKLTLQIALQDFFKLVYTSNIKILDITTNHLIELEKLSILHKDPFDRIIISQAVAESLSIITKDEVFKNYDVKVIW